MTGGSIEAIGNRQAALAARHATSAEADRVLADALARAHATTVEGLRRLDAIETDIEAAVTKQAALALDTAMGAREFQKFLLAKQQEITSVISEARDLASTSKAALDALREHYGNPAQA
jgi:hypothetical protein